MAIPRITLRGVNAGIALPQPLSPSDAVLMRRAFALQDRGNIPAASRLAAELQNPVLLGHLLADRYLGRFHHSTASELTAWLDHYDDQPDAEAIRSLLLQRVPKGTAVPSVPAVAALPPIPPANAAHQDDDADAVAISRDPFLDRAIAGRLDRGATRSALNLIESTKGLRPAYAALLRGEVARWLFSHNDDDGALRTAYLGLERTPAAQQPGLPAYLGGLAAWRLGRIIEARGMFQLAAEAPMASPRIRGAAAFWASRAARRMRDSASAGRWLLRSADETSTLYGTIARRRLGLPTGIIPSTDLLSQADVDSVAATDPGWRAFALLQIGQVGRAEKELRSLWPHVQDKVAQRRSLLLVASALGMTELAAQIVEASAAAAGQSIDALHSPVPRLHPDGGFQVDPALVYALTRVESNFDARAVSPSGARGLMQIMPVTARYISGNAAFESQSLHDPSLNLALGQRYLAYLARQNAIGDDLLHMLVSYNAGPNALAHWCASVRDEGDPLLFIEAIPNDETRSFVEHTLTYTWIYAARLHLPAPSLDELAAGVWPRFTPPPERGRIGAAEPRMH